MKRRPAVAATEEAAVSRLPRARHAPSHNNPDRNGLILILLHFTQEFTFILHQILTLFRNNCTLTQS